MKSVKPLLVATLAGAVAATALPAAGQAQQGAVPAPTTCPRAQQMGEHMKRMQAMHEMMANAKAPAERARLHDEQWRLMREGMGMMRGTGGMGMGMGMGMGPGAGMRGGMGACTGERMAMMEMMMQMMMDRMDPAPGK